MKRVERSEILDLGGYEQIREHFRRRIIELKDIRRVALGANMTVLFENRDTVLCQIQEMLRTERITREDAILHELETYNELIPTKDQLSATIFVEYQEHDERERMLAALAGLENKFYLEVGGVRCAVQNETRGTLPDRTTAVHYAKFPLSPESAEAVRRGKGAVVLGVEHPAYAARVDLSRKTLEELAQDLA
jgi:Protein of unknown function (DUF3501)